MPTLRQKALAKKIIEAVDMTPPPTKQQLLESVGYPQSTATTYAGEVLNQKGVKEALAEFGFSEDIAKKVVGDILTSTKSSDKNKLTAADMTFKVHGTYAPEKKLNLNIETDFEGYDELIAIAEGRSHVLKQSFITAIDERASSEGSSNEHSHVQPPSQDTE